MALFNGEGFDELLEDFKRHKDLLDEAAPEILQAGAEVITEYWKDAIEKHGLIDTGDMINSVGPSKATLTSSEKKIAVYPQGKDRKGVRNAEKAFINHYGASRRKATHFVDDAETNAEEPAIEAMAEAWYQKLDTEG